MVVEAHQKPAPSRESLLMPKSAPELNPLAQLQPTIRRRLERFKG
jgi:hypothetical protein